MHRNLAVGFIAAGPIAAGAMLTTEARDDGRGRGLEPSELRRRHPVALTGPTVSLTSNLYPLSINPGL